MAKAAKDCTPEELAAREQAAMEKRLAKKRKEPETDCAFFLKKENDCRALTEVMCEQKETCHFYKHRSEVNFAAIESAVAKYDGKKAKEE